MPRRRPGIPKVNEEIYYEKMLRLRAAQLVPFIGVDRAAEVAGNVAQMMLSKWAEGFGHIRRPYYKVVAPILNRENIKGPLRALYRAFVCRLISKVIRLKTQSADGVIADFVAMGADEAILREICDKLGAPVAAPAEVPEEA